MYRDKKLVWGCPDFFAAGQTTTRNDAVHMYVIIQFLIPCMQDLNDPGCCSEILLVRRKFQKCFGTASVKKPIQKFLIAIE